MNNVRVRFAPSPTGYLHIGNVRTALFNYLFARCAGGTFILRVEDTDPGRSKEEYRRALMEDLLWMGIHWDEGPEVGGPYGPYLSSERFSIYQSYANELIKQGKAYYCYVMEEEIEDMKRLARAEKRPPRFDNRGRNFTKEEIEKRKVRGAKPTIRFKIENPKLKITDLIRGEVSFDLDEMLGDFVIQRADGTPTFHLAVCVDDGLMKVTHVIRGEDHLSNTPKHILLLEAMGFKPPQYGHLSLIHGEGGEPLSKRLESVSVKEFRRKGVLPHALANYIALLGWSPGTNQEIFKWEELQKAFDLAQVNKHASTYDSKKLDWVNGQHLRNLSDEEFARHALAYLKSEKLLKHDETLVHKILPVFKDNIERFAKLPERLEILSDSFTYEHQDSIKSEEAKEIFRAALDILNVGASLVDARKGQAQGLPLQFDDFANRLKPKVKAKGKALFMPLRIALTGKEHGPELKRIFPVFGLDRIKKRFERALSV
ncbi:MAG: glutamate--tRNA ligase [Candidatus Omnitrophica bacterium]|nr:glutamate--tRNA ligase [Candidatus Omnitrophota bacterium]